MTSIRGPFRESRATRASPRQTAMSPTTSKMIGEMRILKENSLTATTQPHRKGSVTHCQGQMVP